MKTKYSNTLDAKTGQTPIVIYNPWFQTLEQLIL